MGEEQFYNYIEEEEETEEIQTKYIKLPPENSWELSEISDETEGQSSDVTTFRLWNESEGSEESTPEHGDLLPDIPSEKLLSTIVYDNFSEKHPSTGTKERCSWEELDEKETEISIFTAENMVCEEQEAEYICHERKVTVKFTTDTEETMKSNFTVSTNLLAVKARLAKVFKVTVKDIKLKYEGKEFDDESILSELISGTTDMIDMQVQSTDHDRILAPGEFSLYVIRIKEKTVWVPRDVGGYKPIYITIEYHNYVKEWLGGLMDKNTKTEYHHASQQTLPRRRPPDSLPLFSRTTQTPVFPLKETADDTTRTRATQVWRTDHFISSSCDTILLTDPDRFIPVKGFTSFYSVANFVVLVQRFCRNIRTRLEDRKKKEQKELCFKIEEDAKIRRINEIRAANRKLILNSTLPRHRSDFYQLYLTVGCWWRASDKKIKATRHAEAKGAALIEMLEKEMVMLSSIERLRIEAKTEALRKQQLYVLESCARQLIFTNQASKMSSMDTLHTQQAREYMEIISSYINDTVSVCERIDVLSVLKQLLNSLDSYEYVKVAVKLIERESELLRIGVQGKYIKVLRERIKQLLVGELYAEVVNPKVKNFRKPSWPRTVDRLYLCFACKKLKPASDYNVHVKMASFLKCHSCEWLHNIGVERGNLTPYDKMLQLVRESEMAECCNSSVAFILQPVGMQYLIRRIWKCKSIISDKSYLEDLRMIRFRKEEDWAPWNCILLTLEESATHKKIDDIYAFYAEPMLNRITWRHLRARNHFLPLLLNDRFVQETNLWVNVRDAGKFVHPSHISKFAKMEDFEYI